MVDDSDGMFGWTKATFKPGDDDSARVGSGDVEGVFRLLGIRVVSARYNGDSRARAVSQSDCPFVFFF